MTERRDSASVYIARIDSTIKFIHISGGGFVVLTPKIVRVDNTDTIWISLSILKKFRGSIEPAHELSVYLSDDSTRLIIQADISRLSASEKLGSSVECTPEPEHGYIDAATVFLPTSYPLEIVQ
jgi:hypothetical protein